MITGYNSPNYDPYRNISPYADQNTTGAREAMERQHKLMLEASESAQIDRIMNEVRELRYRVERIDDRFSEPVRMFEPITMFEPEPSVEEDHSPSWFSRLWEGFVTDPVWEFLRRPSIK